MDSSKKIKIKYETLMKEVQSDGHVGVKMFDSETEVDMQFINVYVRFLSAMVEFKSIRTVNLLAFIVHYCDDDGCFVNSELFRRKFNKEMSLHGRKEWSKQAFHDHLNYLMDFDIMIRDSKSVYKLNPEYVLKGHFTRSKRIKEIQMYLKVSRSDIYKGRFKGQVDVELQDIEE